MMRRCLLRRAFSLVELLIVIGIFGLLLQLLIPAVIAAREGARRTHCSNNLRQIGLAMTLHHDAFRRYPSGGWHFDWIGEPERGTRMDQPGSWVFNLLDYVGEPKLRAMGRDLDGDERAAALRKRCEVPLGLFICPTRRDVQSYPHTWNASPYTRDGALPVELEVAAKTDYAANVGDTEAVEFDWRWSGPKSLEEGDDPEFDWPDVNFTGVVFGRSQIGQKHLKDGSSKTYLVGEKAIDWEQYESGADFGDNENMYMGFNNDTTRSTLQPPVLDTSTVEDLKNRFGSAHLNIWQVVLCDGSVHRMSYEIDPDVHRAFGNRRDTE